MTDIAIWVDFNSRDSAGRTPALVRHATRDVSVGERVLVGDDDGNRCWADIVGIDDNGVLHLALDEGTFEIADVRVGVENPNRRS